MAFKDNYLAQTLYNGDRYGFKIKLETAKFLNKLIL